MNKPKKKFFRVEIRPNVNGDETYHFQSEGLGDFELLGVLTYYQQRALAQMFVNAKDVKDVILDGDSHIGRNTSN